MLAWLNFAIAVWLLLDRYIPPLADHLARTAPRHYDERH